MKEILLDANIASTFLKTNLLPLLKSLFQSHRLVIPVAVRDELLAARFNQIPFDIMTLTSVERKTHEKLSTNYGALGKGELECIVLGVSRSLPMLTNDRRAKNAAIKEGIRCWDLSEILRALRMKGIIDDNELGVVIKIIEEKDNIIFKNSEKLFEDSES